MTNAEAASAAVPVCVGIILDGNRRWAEREHVSQLAGHREGLAVFKKIAIHARDRGVAHLVAYLFSTENWERSAEEVAYLMDLFRDAMARELANLIKEDMRVRFIGERDRFAPDLRTLMDTVEADSAGKTGMTVWLCLSYGGRAEIVDAAKKAAAAAEALTQESLRAHMWSTQMPDPDLIIRTGGEKRLSGFLLWQCAYSELSFVDTLWPDFTPLAFDRILADYPVRERRHGR